MKIQAIATAAALAAAGAWGAPTPALHVIPATDPHIVRMGRTAVTADGGLRFAYPGVRLSFNFTGTTLSFDAWSSGSKSYLEAVVDGGAPQVFALTGERRTITLLQSDASAAHTVEIMHRAELWHGVVTLAGLRTDGKLGEPPVLPQRRMLVLGDSVTCAEGVERSGDSRTDPRHSYGMLLARAMNAQVQLVCHGGRGLVRSWDGRTDEHNLADFYELAIASAKEPVRWDHKQYDPDLILSAIGTNDFSKGIPEREAYVSAYVSLVRTLLRNHPRARIVLTEGAILHGEKKEALSQYINDTVRRVNDARVHAVPSRHHPGDEKDAHPTGPQHAAMARELAPSLRKLMNWKPYHASQD